MAVSTKLDYNKSHYKLDPNLYYDSQLMSDAHTARIYYNYGTENAGELMRWVCNNPQAAISISNSYQGATETAFMNTINNARQSMQKAMDQASTDLNLGSDLFGAFKEWIGWGSADTGEETTDTVKGQGKFKALLDKGKTWGTGKLLVGTDYVKVYSGSTASYSLPSTEVMIYPGYTPDGMSLRAYLKKLLPYFMGEFTSLNTQDKNYDSNHGAIAGIMRAPGPTGDTARYLPKFQNIGNTKPIQGTFSVVIGAGKNRVRYRNLLCNSCSITMSTTLCSTPGVWEGEPSWIKLDLGFEPCSFITQNVIRETLQLGN